MEVKAVKRYDDFVNDFPFKVKDAGKENMDNLERVDRLPSWYVAVAPWYAAANAKYKKKTHCKRSIIRPYQCGTSPSNDFNAYHVAQRTLKEENDRLKRENERLHQSCASSAEEHKRYKSKLQKLETSMMDLFGKETTNQSEVSKCGCSAVPDVGQEDFRSWFKIKVKDEEDGSHELRDSHDHHQDLKPEKLCEKPVSTSVSKMLRKHETEMETVERYRSELQRQRDDIVRNVTRARTALLIERMKMKEEMTRLQALQQNLQGQPLGAGNEAELEMSESPHSPDNAEVAAKQKNEGKKRKDRLAKLMSKSQDLHIQLEELRQRRDSIKGT